MSDPNSERSYDAMKVHLGTVAGNEALVIEAAAKYPNLRVSGLNPGFAKTNIRANMYGDAKARRAIMESLIGLVAPTADKYAQTIVPLLVSDDIDTHSGAMFGSKGQAIQLSASMTPVHAAAIIETSRHLVQRLVPHVHIS